MIIKTIKKHLILIIISILLPYLSVCGNCNDLKDDIISSCTSSIDSISNLFTESIIHKKPIGLTIRDGFIKNICISFNTGLHNLSQIEQLPISPVNPDTREVPILLYHHITQEKGYGNNVLSASLLEEHLQAIKDAGYVTISARELVDFVYYGTALPEKPILITFDDGYYSNYSLAYPLLKKYNMKAIFFTIGWAIGKDTYKDYDKSIIPHFGFDEIDEMLSSGLIEIQSHTFDLHQSPSIEKHDKVRENALPLTNESEEEYISALEKDYSTFDKLLFNCTGYRNYAISYPHGEYTKTSEEVFKRLGTYITFSTEYKYKNVIVQGDLDSLRVLNRFTIAENIPKEQIITLINSVYK